MQKYQLLQLLLNFIYQNKEVKLKELLEQIHTHQASFTVTNGSFRYKGKAYYATRYGAMGLRYLDENLYPHMDSYLKQSNELEKEKALVSSYLQAVLNQVNEPSYLYSYLPSALHSVLQLDGIVQTNLEPPELDSVLMGINQDGYELLLTRLMLNMVGE